MNSTHHNQPFQGMRLYDDQSNRLYLNNSERTAFLEVAGGRALKIRSFCLVLALTGCRLSEALALRASSVQLEEHTITFTTLKRRRHCVREIPIPPELSFDLRCMIEFDQTTHLWIEDGKPINRSTAYRWIKNVMAQADIRGAMACPKGLRHGYGIHAVMNGVPLNMLQKWMGHASIETTMIYANAIGHEERELARRMW